MRVLLVSPLPPPNGGIATWTEMYQNALTKQNHQCEVINTALHSKRKNHPNNRYIVEETQRFLKIRRELRKCAKKGEYIAHINSSGSTMGLIRDYFLCINLKKTQTVIQFHCDLGFLKKTLIRKFLLKLISKRVKTSICINKSSYDFLKSIGVNHLDLIPNFYSKEYERHDYRNKLSNVLFVGRICRDKGVDIIYELSKYLPDIMFTLVGFVEDNSYIINKPSNVVLLGDSSWNVIKREMQKTDLFLFPSLHEGFPMVILEAMAFSLPIISSKAGAIPDILDDNSGIVVEDNNVESYFHYINTTITLEKRQEIGSNAYKKVKKYDIEQIVHNFLSVYRR